MNCKLGAIPMKYLGMPISSRAVTMGDLQPVVDKKLPREWNLGKAGCWPRVDG